ncbi:MAG: class II fructose-bisphosphate aldolase [Methanosarcinales archaeon]
MSKYGPIAGSAIFNSLNGHKTIVMAANPRIALVAKGIFKAAKDLDAAVIMELAKSECDLKGGYTGLTPKTFSEKMRQAAEEVEFDIWALHADHTTIKKGDEEEIESTKKLIDAHVDAGYTSFAIDASHLFNFEGGDLREELDDNIRATTILAKHIQKRMGDKPYGLEVEVGEIGREDEHGRVLTKPEEAVVFIKALNENGIYPQVLAIANGSAHGNIYDEFGNLIEQVSIDIPQTKAIAKALKDNNLQVNIAQHGITGTPRELINTQFPKGDIIKGNVGTFWQNLVWDIIKVYQPDLYKEIRNWTLDNYREKAPDKKDDQIFGTYSKFAIKEFFDQIYSVDEETIHAIEAMAYAESLTFFRAFSSKGSAKIVRSALKKP